MKTYLEIRKWQLEQIRQYSKSSPHPYLLFVAWSNYWAYPFWRVGINAFMRFKGIDPNEIEKDVLIGLRLAGDQIADKILHSKV